MSNPIIYKNLFEIKILHHYFLDKGNGAWDKMNQEEKDKMEEKYDVRDIFDITPTSDCRKVLSSHKCIFKLTSTGILIGIKAQQDNTQHQDFKPFIPLEKDLTFRFLIRINDPNFTNYTALPLQGNDGNMFVFNNNSTITSIKYPSISAIPPVYKTGTDYMPGDMLSDDINNQTKLFTALVKTNKNTSTAEDWLSETGNANTPLNYANVNDRYPAVNGFFYYRMKEEKAKPVATLKTLSGDNIHPKMEILSGDFNTLQVDLRNFPSGFYTAHIDSDDPVYKDDILFYLLNQTEIPFGLIEIKVKSNQPDYNLIGNDFLLSPTFELRFRNRRTHWRYFGKIFNTPYEVENPLPLTRFGFIEIVKSLDPGGTKTIMLPNPSNTMIQPDALIKNDANKYYSEIHIN